MLLLIGRGVDCEVDIILVRTMGVATDRPVFRIITGAGVVRGGGGGVVVVVVDEGNDVEDGVGGMVDEGVKVNASSSIRCCRKEEMR